MTTKPKIAVRRVYETSVDADGESFLVDRLWPRGIRKETLAHCTWLKEVAPSNALRSWYHKDPTQWREFAHRYEAELDAHPTAWRPLLDALDRNPIVLLYASKDVEHNHAIVLRDYLLRKLG